jgi:hypothetical protein
LFLVTTAPKRLLGSSVVDPHHREADPDSDFCLMRVRFRLCTVMRIRIQILASK